MVNIMDILQFAKKENLVIPSENTTFIVRQK